VDIDAYLERIGAPPPAAVTLDALAELVLAQLYSVPFENLDIAAGRRLSVDVEAIHDKIVTRRRGGFCYELNGLFAGLLRELAERVERRRRGPLGSDPLEIGVDVHVGILAVRSGRL